MFWLGLLLTVCFVPGYTGASVPTQWAVLSILLPLGLWRTPLTSVGHKLFLGFLAYAALSTLWALNWYTSVWGLWLVCIWFLTYHWGTGHHDLRSLWRGMAIGLAASSAVALAQALEFTPVEVADINRPAGLMFNSALFGVTLGLVLVALCEHKLWWYTPPLALGLILSGSRGGIVVLAAGLLARFAPPLTVLVLAICGALGLAYLYDPSDAQRLQIWGVTLGAISPLGWGPGSFLDLYFVRHTGLMLLHPEYVHNDFLQLAYEYGLGALPLLALFALALARTQSPEWPTFVAFCTAAAFFFPLYAPLTAFMGFMVAGSMLRYRPLARRDSHDWRPSFLSRLADAGPVSDSNGRETLPVVARTPHEG